MLHYCTSCGAELKKDSKFCSKCGNNIVQEPTNQNQKEQTKTQQHHQPVLQQQPSPIQKKTQQTSQIVNTKKSYIKIIGVIIAIAVILILLLIVFFILSGDDNEDSKSGIEQKFIGTWQSVYTDDSGRKNTNSNYIWEFKKDYTFESWSIDSDATYNGSWELKEGKISLPIIYYEETWFKYSFTNEDNTLTLYYSNGSKDLETGNLLYLEMRLFKFFEDDSVNGDNNGGIVINIKDLYGNWKFTYSSSSLNG